MNFQTFELNKNNFWKHQPKFSVFKFNKSARNHSRIEGKTTFENRVTKSMKITMQNH